MSSPNEPGYPRAGDGPGSANGSAGGPRDDGGSLGNAASRTGPTVAPSPPTPVTSRRGSAGRRRSGAAGTARQTAGVAGADGSRRAARLARGHSPRRRRPAEPLHRGRIGSRRRRTGARAGRRRARRRAPSTGHRPEAYASELPDLSGPIPRPPQQRKPAPERTDAGTGRAGRTPPAASRWAPGQQRPGAGQHADPPDRPVERAEGVAGVVGRAVLRVDDRGRVPVPRARRHGRVEQAQQQRRRPAHQRQRQHRRRTGVQRHHLRRRGADRTGEHRAADGDGDASGRSSTTSPPTSSAASR